MNKVIYNNCFGKFGLSKCAIDWFKDRYNLSEKEVYTLPRHDPRLVDCIITLKEKANNLYSSLEIMDIEGDVYRIDDYNGKETVLEPKDDSDWIKID